MKVLVMATMEARRVLSVIIMLAALTACARPDLVIRDLEVWKPSDPSDVYDVRYRFAVENRDYGGNIFWQPTAARGEIYVQAYLSSNGAAQDGAGAGGARVLSADRSIPVGGQVNDALGCTVQLDKLHPFLLLKVWSESGQKEYSKGNNTASRLIDPSPPSDLEQWLREHPSVKTNIRWEEPGGNIVQYQDWDNVMKEALQKDVNGILAGTPRTIPDPPPLSYQPTDTESPLTTFNLDTAWSIYLMHVARSIVSEEFLPWSVNDVSSEGLSILFDSRSLFSWDANRSAYRVVYTSHGSATPGDPNNVFKFLEDNDMIGDSPAETIYRLLEWSKGLQHYFGYDTAGNYFAHWQYRGKPPISRILSGTTNTDFPNRGVQHYTAGCWGTSAFLSLVLRTVNIPVRHEIYASHAHPHFLSERTFLSHGDDPYNLHLKTSPWIPMSELPISETKHEMWFGSGLSDAEQSANTGRRVYELVLEYLSRPLVQDHCQDVASQVPRNESKVYDYFSRFYTLEELEAVDLWGRLDAKAAELGLCTP
jgi:hypothetical protein